MALLNVDTKSELEMYPVNFRCKALVILLIVCVAFCSICCYVENAHKNLKRKGVITRGTITGMDIVFRGGGMWVKYEFEIDGRVVKDKRIINASAGYLDGLSSKLLGKAMPVIYDTCDYMNNMLLVTQDEFFEYNVIPSNSEITFSKLLDSLKKRK